MDNRPPKHLRTLKRGDVREDGMLFLQYNPFARNGEQWGTSEQLERLRATNKKACQKRGKGRTVPKEKRTLSRGDVRGDGKVFWRYDGHCINGENWITQELFDERHEKAYKTLVRLKENKPDWNANYMREWRKEPSNRIAHNQRSRIHEVLRGIVKHNHTLEMIGCTAKELKNYLASKFTDGMTWENYGRYGWHVDHIRPCASFDFTDPEQQKQCFHYTNLQPLWARDNLSKGAKHKPIK